MSMQRFGSLSAKTAWTVPEIPKCNQPTPKAVKKAGAGKCIRMNKHEGFCKNDAGTEWTVKAK